MLVDLHHDRLIQVPVSVVADVQAAVIFHADTMTRAGHEIGLTKSEYGEFERRVLAGDLRDGPLPEHLDAMAGRGKTRGVYALHSVHVRPAERAFVITLSDGARVYVPHVCGNLSLLRGRPPVIAHAKPHYRRPSPPRARARVAVRPVPTASAQTAAPAPIAPPAMVAAQPPVAAPVTAVAKQRVFPLLPFFGWVSAGVGSLLNDNSPAPPSCNSGLMSDTHVCSR